MNLHALACALSDAIAERGVRAIGRITGEAHTTILRRGEDLGAWPVSALLSLAEADDAVRSAVLSALSRDDADGAQLEADARATVRDAGAIVASLMDALQDQRITAQERRRLLPDARRLSEDLRRLVAAMERA